MCRRLSNQAVSCSRCHGTQRAKLGYRTGKLLALVFQARAAAVPGSGCSGWLDVGDGRVQAVDLGVIWPRLADRYWRSQGHPGALMTSEQALIVAVSMRQRVLNECTVVFGNDRPACLEGASRDAL